MSMRASGANFWALGIAFRSLVFMAAVFALTSSGELSAQKKGKSAPLAGVPASLLVSFEAPQDPWLVKQGAFQAGQDGPNNSYSLTAVEGPKGKVMVVLESPGVHAGARRLTAMVRLRGEGPLGSRAEIAIAPKDAKTGLRMSLYATKGSESITCSVSRDGKALVDANQQASKLDWVPMNSSRFVFYPRAYPFSSIRPGWPDDYRARIEADMASLPDVPDKWLAVRIELKPGHARFWLEDRLVAIADDPSLELDGVTQVTLGLGSQLAALHVEPWPEVTGFEPVKLDAYNNGKGLMGVVGVAPGSLPNRVVVGGVPFEVSQVNPEGFDHIDVSRSYYRQANLEGYHQSLGPRWVGASHRDPARIQLRVPNGHYNMLYLLAAADTRPNHIPLITAMFYRPSAGYAERFETEVPLATAEGEADKLPVTLANGKTANLWLVKIPLDPGKLSSFADLDTVEIELTKKTAQYRSYPDPIIYGFHQAGPPSSVQVYGLTLGTCPVDFSIQPVPFGHVWTKPEKPKYLARFKNRRNTPVRGTLQVETRSYDGTEKTNLSFAVKLAAGEEKTEEIQFSVQLHGYHDLTTTLLVDGERPWTEKRSFVLLKEDTRAVRWKEGEGALFGYWSYHGGHHTPKAEHHVRLMTLAGARTSIGSFKRGEHELVDKHWGRTNAGAWTVQPQAWAAEEPVDPEKYKAYQQQVVEEFRKARAAIPPQHLPDHVYFFPEPRISPRLTEGNYPEYWNGEPYVYNEEEKKRLRMFMVTAQCAAEAVRKEFPELKILIPWGDPLFIVPLLRAGFPRELIDGMGIDIPGFERLPEMQLGQGSIHRLYQLRKEFEKAGIPKPLLQFTEGIFVPTEPGAVSWREQMDIYLRSTLISMAYGVERFYSSWFCFDAGNYYGSEHYGGCGIQRRIPYCDPKPAYAAYATMTQMLDRANFAGWLPTGSHSTYCLKFQGPNGPVYTLWTIRGRRPVQLHLAGDGAITVTDCMNNSRTVPSSNRVAVVMTDPSVLFVTGQEIRQIQVGDPDHSDSAPAEGAVAVADLGDGSWSVTSERDKIYENGCVSIVRYPGKFSAEVTADPGQGKVLRTILEKQEVEHQLMPWYTTLVPKKPVIFPAMPSHVGLWVKGASDWGRVVYVLKDAKGERWTSIGYQDQYNCDDVHSWSCFNFDGWRYVRFELPGNLPYDLFKTHGSTWWRSDGGDNIVDLPLSLDRMIIEQRSHILYVNDVQPVASNAVCFGKMFVEYAKPEDSKPTSVTASRLRMPPPPATVANLPNPIAKLQNEGEHEPTSILKLEPPLDRNDGTTAFVHFKPVEGAKSYSVWVSARPDGRGAVNMTPRGATSGVQIRGLRPGKFYFWVTYVGADGKPSKPSPVSEITLVDTFGEK